MPRRDSLSARRSRRALFLQGPGQLEVPGPQFGDLVGHLDRSMACSIFSRDHHQDLRQGMEVSSSSKPFPGLGPEGFNVRLLLLEEEWPMMRLPSLRPSTRIGVAISQRLFLPCTGGLAPLEARRDGVALDAGFAGFGMGPVKVGPQTVPAGGAQDAPLQVYHPTLGPAILERASRSSCIRPGQRYRRGLSPQGLSPGCARIQRLFFALMSLPSWE